MVDTIARLLMKQISNGTVGLELKQSNFINSHICAYHRKLMHVQYGTVFISRNVYLYVK